MKLNLTTGAEHTASRVVGPDDTAARYGSGLLEVFSTPAMIAFMENTAMKLVQTQLAEGYNTVGTEVCVRHLRATPMGATVHCVARLISAEGKKLVFEVEVSDENGTAGKGTHTRYIINTEEFLAALGKK
jgi:fluoroacetyl-CoA thioesterase